MPFFELPLILEPVAVLTEAGQCHLGTSVSLMTLRGVDLHLVRGRGQRHMPLVNADIGDVDLRESTHRAEQD